MRAIILLKLTIIAVLSGFIITGFSPGHTSDIQNPRVVNGVLDLTDWDFEKNGIVIIDGEWEFYWQQLLQPLDFTSQNTPQKTGLIKIPGPWNGYTVDDEKLPGYGYATYKLAIKTKPTNDLLGIKLPEAHSAYRLWVNNELISNNGQVGKSETEMIPQYLPRVVFFEAEGDTILLLIQVSNFVNHKGGILDNLQIGTESQIQLKRDRNLAFEMFLFGSLLIMGIYHLGFFVFRTKEVSLLLFGLFCIVISIRTLVVEEIFFSELFPNFNWEIQLKIDYLAFYLGGPLFVMFLKSVFPREISDRVLYFYQASGIAFCVMVLATSAKVYSQYNSIYHLITFMVILHLFYALVLACCRKREGALLISVGIIFFILTVINDMIFENALAFDIAFLKTIVTKENLSSWGLLVFVFTQSQILAMRFSKSFSDVEKLSGQLKELNENLEVMVKERTGALEQSNRRLNEMNKDLSRMEKSRRHFITNISHDLQTPMTLIRGYVEAILDGMVDEPEQQKKYLQQTLNKITGLNRLTQELFELAQLESRQVQLNLRQITINQLIRLTHEKYRPDVESAGLRFDLHIQQPVTAAQSGETGSPETGLVVYPTVATDPYRIDRVFANLIYNAIKHTPRGGFIRLSCDFISGQVNHESEPPVQEVLISVQDNGSGIGEEDLLYIFDRFYTGSKSRKPSSGNSGLGLSIAKEIVEFHGGRIWAVSKLNEGSTFSFTLPIC